VQFQARQGRQAVEKWPPEGGHTQLLQPARDPQARKGKQGMKCHLELFETTKDNNKRRKREESEQATSATERLQK